MDNRHRKYLSAFNFPPSYGRPIENLHIAQLKPVAQTYKANMERIRAIGFTPLILASISNNYESSILTYNQMLVKYINAHFELNKSPQNNNIDREDTLKLMLDKLNKEIEQTLAERTHNFSEFLGLGVSDQFLIRIMGQDYLTFNNYSVDFSHFLQGVDASLESMIVGTWTAIETLSGDLWEAALNAEPRVLAKLRGGRKGENDNVELKKIDLNLVHKHKYTLSNAMGTILRPKFSFSKLDGIIEAYVKAFSKDADRVIELIGSRPLFVLSAVRNLLVHKAGIVDEEFEKKMRKEHYFSHYQPNERLFFDGDIVKSLIEPAVLCSADLITAVDEWLVNHPGKYDGEDSE